jgi:hypothetical protein
MPIGDKDIGRIKGNIKLMIDKDAPDEDIDGYLSEEGISLTDLQAQTPQERTWAEVGKESLSNIPKSALEYGKALVSPVLHPIDTAKMVGKIAAEKLYPPLQLKPGSIMQKGGEMLKSRYGGMDNLKQTIATDPVGLLGDVATLTSIAGAAGNLPKVSRIGAMMEPASLAMAPLKAIPKGLAKIPGMTPERLYLSAVKPGFSKKKGLTQIKKEAHAGLEEGILPNEAGIRKVEKAISGIEEKTIGPITEAASAGTKITKEQALRHVGEVIDNAKDLKYSPYPKESLDIIKDATTKFIEEFGDNLDVLTAHKAKKAFYAQNRPKYGKQTGQVPNEQAITEKAIARGLKDSVYEALANKHPELRALGEKEGALIGLKSAIEQGAQRITRRDILGIGVPIKTGVASWIGSKFGSPALGTIVGVTAGVIDTPAVKARLAVALHRAKKIKVVNERNAKLRMGSRLAGELQEEENE